jgi:2,5-diketo-D-gluconate reductase B
MGESTNVTISGVDVPALGFGTWQITGDGAREAVLDALELGYRHIDTARMYENEPEVGAGLRESAIPRDEIWLTTKVWQDNARADDLHRSAERQLSDLGVDAVDLLLLHWPAAGVALSETLDAMTRLREEGLIRELGVSNFPSALLREAVQLAPVFCNQVEYHPYLSQAAVLDVCREHDVLLTAYSPFAHGHLLDDPVLTEIGAAHGKSAGQVSLRWLLDQPGVAVIPKASSHDRRAQNLDVFDFTLDDDERDRIAGLERGRRTANPPWAPAWD